ncbi:MAG: hypothetical protein Q9214_005500 [Letrouitia sp. 1 TL-2023]
MVMDSMASKGYSEHTSSIIQGHCNISRELLLDLTIDSLPIRMRSTFVFTAKRSIQSFYAQIREIEAETSCYFDDIFLIDTERAIDYASVWIQTYQNHQKPCAGLKK